MNIFDKVSVFDLKKAGLINLAVGGINVLIHISVIAGLLPYMWFKYCGDPNRHVYNACGCKNYSRKIQSLLGNCFYGVFNGDAAACFCGDCSAVFGNFV